MDKEINKKTKNLYIIITILVVVIIAGISYVIAQSSAPKPCHAAGEIGEGTIANALTISSGNVGIGISPSARFHSKSPNGIHGAAALVMQEH